jgi:hypothetical protein
MELTVEPDMYAPSIDPAGNYVDKIPPFNTIKKGLRCPCGSRKDKIYETHKIFSSHINTKIHQKSIRPKQFIVHKTMGKRVYGRSRLLCLQRFPS